jgi:WD40 repeat protein
MSEGNQDFHFGIKDYVYTCDSDLNFTKVRSIHSTPQTIHPSSNSTLFVGGSCGKAYKYVAYSAAPSSQYKPFNDNLPIIKILATHLPNVNLVAKATQFHFMRFDRGVYARVSNEVLNTRSHAMTIAGQVVFAGVDKILDSFRSQSNNGLVQIVKNSNSKSYPNTISNLSTLSDGRITIGSVKGEVSIYDVAKGQATENFQPHTDKVYQVVKDGPNGIISCSADKTVKLWDLRTNTASQSFGPFMNSVTNIANLTDNTFVIGSKKSVTSLDKRFNV